MYMTHFTRYGTKLEKGTYITFPANTHIVGSIRCCKPLYFQVVQLEMKYNLKFIDLKLTDYNDVTKNDFTHTGKVAYVTNRGWRDAYIILTRLISSKKITIGINNITREVLSIGANPNAELVNELEDFLL